MRSRWDLRTRRESTADQINRFSQHAPFLKVYEFGKCLTRSPAQVRSRFPQTSYHGVTCLKLSTMPEVEINHRAKTVEDQNIRVPGAPWKNANEM